MQTQRPRYIAVEAGDADTHVAGVALKLQKDGQRAERKAHKDDTTGGGKEIDAGFHQKFLCCCNLPPSGGKALLDTPGNPEKIFSVTSPFRERQAARQHGYIGPPDTVPDGDGATAEGNRDPPEGECGGENAVPRTTEGDGGGIGAVVTCLPERVLAGVVSVRRQCDPKDRLRGKTMPGTSAVRAPCHEAESVVRYGGSAWSFSCGLSDQKNVPEWFLWRT